MTTTTWDGPAWAHITAAGPGLPRLMATIQAITAACDAACALGPATPKIDPYAGWANTTGILAGLTLATGQAAPPNLAPLPTPPSHDAAATVIDQLYRAAADDALHLGLQLRDQLPPAGGDPEAGPVLVALAATMSQLATAYTETFARPW